MVLRLCAIVGNCAFPKDKMRKQDESKKHRNMSTVPQTVGKSGRKKMRNDFHSGFESRVTVGNNNNTNKLTKLGRCDR